MKEKEKKPTSKMLKQEKVKLKKEYRIKKISELLDEYSKGYNKIIPSEKDIIDYEIILRNSKTKYLDIMGKPFESTLTEHNFIDKVKKLDSRFQAQVIILQDNKTIDSFIINDKGRTFARKGMTYVINPLSGKQYYNAGKRNTVYFYYQGNPHAIIFEKNKLPEGAVDSTLLNKVLHFEFLQALANAVRMNKKVDIVMVLSGLTFILAVAIIFICLKGFEFI